MNTSDNDDLVRNRSIVTIQPASNENLIEVSDVHASAFRNYFLTLMGKRFIIEYYSAILDYSGGIILVAKDSVGRVVGFIAGFSDAKRFYVHYRSRRYKLAILSFAAVMRKPFLLGRVIRNVSRVSRGVAHVPRSSRDVELSSFGVLPEYQGYGIGGRLVESFLVKAREFGAESIYLTTDAVENQSVNAFYKAHGFVLEGDKSAGKRQLNVYRHDLEKSY
jgi:GNAT superfamily N-acetyltransferase